jgi:ABC-type transport system involved in multi-copper enzyme maturation permease subunit
MIWLTWRQFRLSAATAIGGLVIIAVVLASTEPGGGGYLSHDHLIDFLSTFLVGVPALIGAFWGAPLVAGELESGTHRLVWTQSVSRTRWLAVKVATIGLAATVATGCLSLMLSAWSSDATNRDRFGTAMFAQRGVVPVAYAAFGLALGIAAGLLIRRTLPAMAATLFGFTAVRLAFQTLVRPHLATPVRISEPLSATNGSPLRVPAGAWTISNDFFDAAGRLAPNIRCGPDAAACMSRYHQVVTYQPADRYWTFQGLESAAFLVLALALLTWSFWWLRTRTS